MGVALSVKAAVIDQLAADAKPAVMTGQEVMGKDFGYDPTSMHQFLSLVAARLAADTPPMTCNWGQLDVNTCLNDNVVTLCAYISLVTQ